MRLLHSRKLCSSSNKFDQFEEFTVVNDENLANLNEEIGQSYRCAVVSL